MTVISLLFSSLILSRHSSSLSLLLFTPCNCLPSFPQAVVVDSKYLSSINENGWMNDARLPAGRFISYGERQLLPAFMGWRRNWSCVGRQCSDMEAVTHPDERTFRSGAWDTVVMINRTLTPHPHPPVVHLKSEISSLHIVKPLSVCPRVFKWKLKRKCLMI